MTGVSNMLDLLIFGVLAALIPLVIFLVYLVLHYWPFITRIFEERPMLMPLRLTPEDLGESVSFPAHDGLL